MKNTPKPWMYMEKETVKQDTSFGSGNIVVKESPYLAIFLYCKHFEQLTCSIQP